MLRPMLDEDYLSRLPQWRGHLLRIAARQLGDRAQAEDIVQDTYLRALESDDGSRPETLQAWLTTVMRHLAIDGLRREAWMRRWLAGDEARADAGHAPSAESEAARAEAVDQALRRLSRRLADADGALVLLREVFETSFRDIAEASGKTEAGCRQQLHRALLRLRQPDAEETAREGAFNLYRQALRERDATMLLALLRPPSMQARAAMAMAASPRPDAPRATSQVVQVGGHLALALMLGGRRLYMLPLGSEQPVSVE